MNQLRYALLAMLSITCRDSFVWKGGEVNVSHLSGINTAY